MPTRTIYCISGLGADERVFQGLRIPGFECRTLQWLTPKNAESLSEYALRLSQKIEGQEAIILGVSFGGMLAVEIAKQRKVGAAVLISSAKTRKEIPLFYRAIGKSGIFRIAPPFALKIFSPLLPWFFGARSPKDKALLKQILKDSDFDLIKGFIIMLLNWDNVVVSPGLITIHGTKDKVLPLSEKGCDYVIQDGGHFMIVSKGREISELLSSILIPPHMHIK